MNDQPKLLGGSTPIQLLLMAEEYHPLFAKMADWWPENARLQLTAAKPDVSLLHSAGWLAGFKVNGR